MLTFQTNVNLNFPVVVKGHKGGFCDVSIIVILASSAAPLKVGMGRNVIKCIRLYIGLCGFPGQVCYNVVTN
ncbi:MAG: hypothetical protein RLZZ568_2345 [Cyanobacteriota bacterium]